MTKKTPPDHCFEDVLEGYLTRRKFLLGAAAVGGSTLVGCGQSDSAKKASPTPKPGTTSLTFTELAHGLDDKLHTAPGYDYQTLVRWGDPIFADSPAFDPHQQTGESQAKQFGYNNDFIGFVSSPLGSGSSTEGLLVVNHEYTNTNMMHPGSPKSLFLDKAQTDVDIAAHGLSVIAINQKDNGQWQVDTSSPMNRRITPLTEMEIVGPAAGNTRLKTAISTDGIKTFGTYGNCAGGVTPWGTILTGEENVDGYFSGDPEKTPEKENYARFGFRKGGWKSWGQHYPRWNMDESPNEPLHMGWVVEIDPFDPNSKPKKLTGLGRCKHEGCNVHINKDGRVVAYTGDDQRFEYIYKFVSKNKYDPNNREANLRLLHEGDLYVAQFKDDGELHWLPLIHGEGPLTEENGFASQGDICIDARGAADAVGATKMDRPEDVEVNPVNGKVYAMLTNNSKRKVTQIDEVNPRAHNKHGQIIEFFPADQDHTQTVFKWNLFLLAGDPNKVVTKYHPDISDNGWLSCPDNCAFDDLGNLWIATDGAEKTSGIGDGLWATEVRGPNTGLTRHFLHCPTGAELCGPFFTPNSENLFVSIQHPGDGSSFEAPSTRWPDFDEGMPPRPSVVVITKNGGGRIGS